MGNHVENSITLHSIKIKVITLAITIKLPMRLYTHFLHASFFPFSFPFNWLATLLSFYYVLKALKPFSGFFRFYVGQGVGFNTLGVVC